ncbi:MAG: protein-L-isoaspartate(D-aspartate) O-methyltransferase [Gammaproteobacteria bacterium]|jgi:protein-L-isoaspartate(D-aspartate) O-methyltransferase|nr:protein-L-isoaspartate(D-aspartate) O-methyltransferase [Gammaproteobacteria bacterium]MBT4605496.1 protein-L-isoaspartate(D-aspartate) O-methyltransferase [Thiotrichales bacterium]MBT3471893.1 protein-L-isoaspartate(D-aspartate) O-methyltransferase [Gammaproteobacteria bacterium]MBT3967058.1 protein-L-isoaspartate(D-aspartate) O-methyltransferase [Gammaproteobacteria bacterium]MBT4079165.1 protein-L-isoaspartate(D-aspartate) O-methyltransferase [Gammaproteobacteria bacterium]
MNREVGFRSRRVRERLIEKLQEKGISNPEVLDAIRTIPRHEFVDEALGHQAYDDTALPIGQEQTISQPFIVALMTEALLRGTPPQRVLEIGTGSGYQTAVLAKLVPQVYTVERIKSLIHRARDRFAEMGILNVEMKLDDGHLGWEEKAPFDAIIVTAAPSGVPKQLFNQLAIGGRMVVPVGPDRQDQQLLELVRTEDGFEQNDLGTVRFVPMRAGAR